MEFKFDVGDRVVLANDFFKGELALGTTGTVIGRGEFAGKPEYSVKVDVIQSDIEAWWIREVDLEAADV
jgi:hypothetical protein